MGKDFTKGQQVTLLGDWDRAGTVWHRACVVYSCGAKRMVLSDAVTGEEIGRNFEPTAAAFGKGGTIASTDAAEVEAHALALAANVLAHERAHFARCLAGNNGEAYDRAIEKQVAALHEPRTMDRTGAR